MLTRVSLACAQLVPFSDQVTTQLFESPNVGLYPEVALTSYPPPIPLAPIQTADSQPMGYPPLGSTSSQPRVATRPTPWISTSPNGIAYEAPSGYSPPEPLFDQVIAQPSLKDYWSWQLLPDGLIYRSYWAGPREPKISTIFLRESQSSFYQSTQGTVTLWDPIVGGRMPLIRFGSHNILRPEGWQLDIEGGAIVRLNLDATRDVEASDFRFGIPLTYGIDKWQFKFGYYHLSSHLGDELIVRTTTAGSPRPRINYVRDAVIFGASYNPVPSVRLYGETAYALFTGGGAEPWEFQFGMEYAKAGPTGRCGTPFFAVNAHLREELNFGGDFTVQTGWLWRGNSGHVIRTGLHYMNGKSTQYQFFSTTEEQIGVGLWYEF